MSNLSEEYLKILNDIEKHISKEDERNYISKKVAELSSLYLDIIDRMTEISSKRIDELEEYEETLDKKISKIKETVDLIKKDIYEDEEYDFEIVCPYCNHEFVSDIESELKEEVECPECHNIIELDWAGDEEDDGCCDGHCSSCGINHDEKSHKDEEDKKENDDDM